MENIDVKTTDFKVQDISINLDSNENIDESTVIIVNNVSGLKPKFSFQYFSVVNNKT